MNVDILQIDIIDTQENNRSLINENVSVQSPRLVYNGSDERFQNLMTSELHFSMQVVNNVDGVFFHLFTGSETRYKVLLKDISDINDVKLIWQGFLLPEQFSEPYQSASFFVDFIATDGIGRIKSSDFLVNKIASKKSVLNVLQQCLSVTGLVLPINFSPAIVNSGFNLDYLDLEVDTLSYINGNSIKSNYDVLVGVLKSIGCKLLQYNAEWYVVGLTRFSDEIIPFKRYVPDLISGMLFDVDFTIARPQLNTSFEAVPVVDVLPPLHKAAVICKMGSKEFIVPEDVVEHLPKLYNSNQADRTPLYWNLVTNKAYIDFKVYLAFETNISGGLNFFYNDFISVPTDKIKTGPYLFIRSVASQVYPTRSDILDTDYQSNYIRLDEPVYLDLKSNEKVSLAIEAAATSYSYVEDKDVLSAAIENGDFDTHFKYALVFKLTKTSPDSEDEIIVSNFSDNPNLDMFFDMKYTANSSELVGKLDLKDLELKKKGYYSLRLYPLVRHTLLSTDIFYKTVSFTVKVDEDLEAVKKLPNGFTTSYELAVVHASSEMKLSKARFNLSESIQQKLDGNTLLTSEFMVTKRFYNTVSGASGTIYSIGLLVSDFNKFNNGYRFFVKKNGSSVIEMLDVNSYDVLESSTQGKIFWQWDVGISSGDYYVQADDELYLKLEGLDYEKVKYKEHYSNKFTRYYINDNSSFSEVLVNSLIDLLDVVKVRVSGVLLGLVSPLEMLLFRYAGEKLFSITDVTLNLAEGVSELVMVEASRGAFVSTILEPSIFISDAAVVPLVPGVVLNWKINLNYVVSNITVIAADVKAKHYSGTLLSVGSPTGYELVGAVSSETGTFTFDFPEVIPEINRGLYQLSISQNGVVSNLVYVEVDPVGWVPSMSIYVTISSNSSDTTVGSPINRVVDYKFTSFTPVTGVFKCQKIDFVTKVPIGGQTVINLTNLAPDVTHTLNSVSFQEGIGYYRIEVVTNEISEIIETFIS